jgi:PIN domain nuclease of toxin-antitoxin system
MSSVVLDASALLAFLRQEPGWERVESILDRSVISSVSLAEVLTLALNHSGTMNQAATVLCRLPITTKPFELADACSSSSLRSSTRRLGLSLGSSFPETVQPDWTGVAS